jgi:hypothetical protein
MINKREEIKVASGTDLLQSLREGISYSTSYIWSDIIPNEWQDGILEFSSILSPVIGLPTI